MMKNKKGMETVVAWVLLLGFSIALGTFVFVWATKGAEKMTQSTLEYVQGGMQCEQVQIDAYFSPDESGKPCKNLTIINKGYLTLEQVMLRGIKGGSTTLNMQVFDKTIADCPGMPLLPRQELKCGREWWQGLETGGAKIDLIPVVKDKKSLITCPDKAKTLDC